MSEKVSVIEDHGLRCVQCLYNLTGLTSGNCPECGWTIDWRLAGDPEARRIGTPAYRAHGAALLPATLFTIASMLFTPWRFAAQLRVDEPLAPALLVALGSCALWLSTGEFRGGVSSNELVVVLAVAVVVAVESLCLATLSGRVTSPRWSWRWRLRLYLLVGLYSTFFVGTWSLVGGPPILGSLTAENFYWPLSLIQVPPNARLGISLIFYWWWLILAVVLFIRNRPRWLAALTFPLVFLLDIGALILVFCMIN